MADDTIVQTDYHGTYQKTIYEATRGSIVLCERLESALYFLEGDDVIRFDFLDGTTEVLLHHENITGIYMTDRNTLFWEENLQQRYLRDLTAGTDTPITEEEFSNMINSGN